MSILKEMGVVFGVMLGIALGVFIIFLPWVLVWSLNVLFETGIPYTIKTYFASLVIFSVLAVPTVRINKN